MILSMTIKTRILSTKISLSRTCQNLIRNGIRVYGHTGIPGLWAQDLDAALWTLDPGCWTLNPGSWTLDPGSWTLDIER